MKKLLGLLGMAVLLFQFDYIWGTKSVTDYTAQIKAIHDNLSKLDDKEFIAGQIAIYQKWDTSELENFMKTLFFKVIGRWLAVGETETKTDVSVSNFGNFIKYLDKIKSDKNLWDRVKNIVVALNIGKEALHLNVERCIQFFEYYNKESKRSKRGGVLGFGGTEYFTEGVELVWQRFLATPEQQAITKAEQAAKEEAAAIKIQSVFRGKLARDLAKKAEELAPLKHGLTELKGSLSTLKTKLGTLESKLVALKGKVSKP
jgi:hypothetical protein